MPSQAEHAGISGLPLQSAPHGIVVLSYEFAGEWLVFRFAKRAYAAT